MSNAIARKLDTIRIKGAMKNTDVANLLGTRPETISRWNQGKASPTRDKEHILLELEYIIDQLSDFYEPDGARLWLYSPQKLLGGEKPAQLIQNGETDKVLAIVNELQDGVFL